MRRKPCNPFLYSQFSCCIEMLSVAARLAEMHEQPHKNPHSLAPAGSNY